MARKTFIAPRLLASCLHAVVLAAGPARAAINLDFTPADILRAASTIAELKVGPVPKDGPWKVTVVRSLKGDAGKDLALDLTDLDETTRDALTTAIAGRDAAPAVYMLGDFGKAAMGAVAAGNRGQPVGTVLVGGKYFGLYQAAAGQPLHLGTDPIAIRTVWAGNAEMTLRLLDYLLENPGAPIPLVSGARWEREVSLGKVAGKVSQCRAVIFRPDATPDLLVASDAGDRLFRRNAQGAWEDVTAAVKLTTKSVHLAFGDFDGDGRLDLVSSDGATLTLARQQADGTFAATPIALPANTTIESLSTLGDGKTAALLVGTKVAPLLITAPDAKPAPLTAAKLPDLGPGGYCVAADLTGDGRADVLQCFEKGVLLYRANPDGTFVAPTAAVTGPLVATVRSAAVGDFDGDGRLDVFLAGTGGTALLRNTGDGRFVEQVQDSGEIGYDDKLEGNAATILDVNNDGRLDLLVTYPNKVPFLFFNRGFCTFGVANDLQWDAGGLHGGQGKQLQATADLRDGQQAATAADFDDDGAQDLAIVANSGQVWLLSAAPGPAVRLGLTVTLPKALAGPASVTAYEGKRCLGARLVLPGEPAFFARTTRGALRLEWILPDGTKGSRIVFLRAKTRVELGAKE